ncbi:MFS transporter [Mycobacterium kansasii]|uniref:Multidrug resistance protein MdtH n=1 Tax=Mycobacterium attenuatum TaxID=2341086 RepID=A0A498PXN0_9MYCO|nr:MFS transporter [Mycobacterium attenuatum]ORB86477.1 MFS transporter [Mycobacterium kansasii]VBA37454.1 Multidrug resistance protein MdtH [Mycobacterium attenuatum]
MGLLTQFRSFNYPSRVLMINHFGINIGSFMLMPYLAGYLTGTLGLPTWALGLLMGVRSLSNQGMFFVGGTFADRVGYKPPIAAGCLIQTCAYAVLAIAHSLPILMLAAAATGIAGALFTPAVRAYLAVDSGDRRVEAFAVFNVFYQAGVLLGPLVGLVLLTMNFRAVVLGAAGVFATLTVVQLLALPDHVADPHQSSTSRGSILQDWRSVVRNRSFLWFAACMTGRYLLTFQIYLALPIQASTLAPHQQSLLVAAMFAVSGLLSITGQLRITRWLASRWEPGRSLFVGAVVMAASFVPLAIVPNAQVLGTAAAVTALLTSTFLLSIASTVMFPFEMRAVVSLSGERLVATHYGFYSTLIGLGVLVGNLGVGSLMGAAHHVNADELPWAVLILIGALAAFGLCRLDCFSPGMRRSGLREKGDLGMSSLAGQRVTNGQHKAEAPEVAIG